MTDLAQHLERLGLDQYLNAFLGEGFDTWEILLDIQEGDLDALNVKLGHRRRLQRAIAEYRGVPYERLVGSPAQEGTGDGRGTEPGRNQQGADRGSGTGAPEAKRKYRRHPKPDENAPERPPSAYVIFSNRVRDEVRGDNLSFTQIAKLVGDRWQKLDSAGKEPYERQAAAAKERYNLELAAYKKTESYKEYADYLSDFKAKHGNPSEGKRPKLELDSSGGSGSTKVSDLSVDSGQGHVRAGSIGSLSSSSIPTTITSPAGHVNPYSATNNSGIPTSARYSAPSPRASSPPSFRQALDTRPRPPFSAQSSLSDDSTAVRSEPGDTLMRTSTLTITAPASGTPPLAPLLPPPAQSDYLNSPEALMRSRWPPLIHQSSSMSTTSTNSYSYSPVGALPPQLNDESWRSRMLDARTHVDLSRTLQPPSALATGGNPTTLPLPALIATEMSQTHAQRTLPPPTSSQSNAHALRSRAFQWPNDSTIPRAEASTGTPTMLRDERSDYEKSVSEAASTLARLAGSQPSTKGAGNPSR